MRRLVGSGLLIAIVIALILVIALVPLFTIYRSECGKGSKKRSEYSFVLPWNDPPADCSKHERGFDTIKDAIGI